MSQSVKTENNDFIPCESYKLYILIVYTKFIIIIGITITHLHDYNNIMTIANE